jgi:uncharacterized protein YjiS (DUF1127 family)
VLGRAGGLLALVLALPLYVLEMTAFWTELARQRRALGMLDERLLRDIGLSRADIEVETSKRFWHS